MPHLAAPPSEYCCRCHASNRYTPKYAGMACAKVIGMTCRKCSGTGRVVREATEEEAATTGTLWVSRACAEPACQFEAAIQARDIAADMRFAMLRRALK